MTARRRRVIARPIRILQINANRSIDIMNSLHAEHLQQTDIILYQEPGFAARPAPPFLPPNLPGFTPYLPAPIEDIRRQDKTPRVMAYARAKDDMTIVPRYDICRDLDMMVLEVQQPGRRAALVVNVYNPGYDSAGAYSTGERLRELTLVHTTPTVIAGDFNLHHTAWQEMDHEPCTAATQLAEWLQQHSFTIHNDYNVPTYVSHDGRFQTVVDLTCSNRMAENATPVRNWHIDRLIGHISDHVGIRYEIGHGSEPTDAHAFDKWNWKKADVERFKTTFSQEVQKNMETVMAIQRAATPSERDIDNLAEVIANALEHAATRAVPVAKVCARSVPWWNETLSALKSVYTNTRQDFADSSRWLGHPDQGLAAEVRRLKNTFKRSCRRAKKKHFTEVLEKAHNKDIYSFRQWSKAARKYVSPPLVMADGSMAVTPTEKSKVFLHTHFPPPADLPDEMPELEGPQPEDIGWTHVTMQECHRALDGTAPDKAPGRDGIPTRALKWAWEAEPEIFHLLISRSIAVGYHPARYHTSVAAVLQKPGKDDYSKPRAWRLVHLLSTTGKWIEKVVANRLIYYGVRHNLIPQSQFGAMPGRSTVDAALCLTHDIKAADNHDLVTSALTFDITGYFDNVNHARLIKILRSKGIPLPLCKWVRSFVSERRVEIRVDGTQTSPTRVRTGCPQGSPVSGVLANYYSAPLLEIFEEEYRRFKEENQDSFNTPSDDLTTHRQTPVSADLFVDDGKLHTSSSSLLSNTRRLARAFERVISWARMNGVSIDYEKVEFIHFVRRGKRIGHQPSIELPVAQNGTQTRTYDPKNHIRWLGIILDTRLTFDAHVQHLVRRGMAASSCLRMLANTVGGLNHSHVKTLYTACVLPAITYATPVWWTGKRTHTKALEKIQNQCLRRILPVFRTTPISAMEVEAGIPPIHLRLDHIYARAAARIAAKIDDSNLVYHRLPREYKRREATENIFTPPLPITPTRRLQRAPVLSPLRRLLSTIPIDIELISPNHLLDPWRPDGIDEALSRRLKACPGIQGTSKREAAEDHLKLTERLAANPGALAVYTDGSQINRNGHRLTGAGWVLYWRGQERDHGSVGLGTSAEVYDAEMTALANGLKGAINFIHQTEDHHPKPTTIFIFADNSSAVRSIPIARPFSSQDASQRFIEAARSFLEGNPRASIMIQWVPGHTGIPGNERADEIAKAACSLAPPNPRTTLSNYLRTARNKLSEDWTNQWTSTDRRSRYAIADRLPPSTLGSYPFRQLDRATLGLVTQIRTGHGYFDARAHTAGLPTVQRGKTYTIRGCTRRTPRNNTGHEEGYRRLGFIPT